MRTLLYFDGENLHWSLMHHHSRELDLGVVLHLAAVEGEVYEARLYADFSRFPREIATRAPWGSTLCMCQAMRMATAMANGKVPRINGSPWTVWSGS
jgi:hypothetical protein